MFTPDVVLYVSISLVGLSFILPLIFDCLPISISAFKHLIRPKNSLKLYGAKFSINALNVLSIAISVICVILFGLLALNTASDVVEGIYSLKRVCARVAVLSIAMSMWGLPTVLTGFSWILVPYAGRSRGNYAAWVTTFHQTIGSLGMFIGLYHVAWMLFWDRDIQVFGLLAGIFLIIAVVGVKSRKYLPYRLFHIIHFSFPLSIIFMVPHLNWAAKKAPGVRDKSTIQFLFWITVFSLSLYIIDRVADAILKSLGSESWEVSKLEPLTNDSLLVHLSLKKKHLNNNTNLLHLPKSGYVTLSLTNNGFLRSLTGSAFTILPSSYSMKYPTREVITSQQKALSISGTDNSLVTSNGVENQWTDEHSIRLLIKRSACLPFRKPDKKKKNQVDDVNINSSLSTVHTTNTLSKSNFHASVSMTDALFDLIKNSPTSQQLNDYARSLVVFGVYKDSLDTDLDTMSSSLCDSIVFLCGGTGITASISSIVTIRDNLLKKCINGMNQIKLKEIHLVWTCRDIQIIEYFKNEIEGLKTQFKNFLRIDFLFTFHCTHIHEEVNSILSSAVEMKSKRLDIATTLSNIVESSYPKYMNDDISNNNKISDFVLGLHVCGPSKLTFDAVNWSHNHQGKMFTSKNNFTDNNNSSTSEVNLKTCIIFRSAEFKFG